MGKCIVCGGEAYKVLFSEAVVKIYIYLEECLKKSWKHVKGFEVWIQKRFRKSEGWLD